MPKLRKSNKGYSNPSSLVREYGRSTAEIPRSTNVRLGGDYMALLFNFTIPYVLNGLQH